MSTSTKKIGSYLLDFYLYSNIHISVGALGLLFFCDRFLALENVPKIYYGFVFTSTLCLYSIHRLYGLYKIGTSQSRRYQAIQSILAPLTGITVISLIFSMILYIYLPSDIKYLLIIPCLVSTGYVLPIWQGKRMRDFDFLKIFLIATIWTAVVSMIPTIEYGQLTANSYGLAAAIFCYMLGITIPFDIRDMDIDTAMGVKTLPAILGSRKASLFALMLLAIAGLLIIGCSNQNTIAGSVMTAGSMVSIGIMIYWYRNAKNDYYYTGILDGTMLLMAILALAF